MESPSNGRKLTKSNWNKSFKKLAPLSDTQNSNGMTGSLPSSKKNIQEKSELIQAVRTMRPVENTVVPSHMWDVGSSLKSSAQDGSDLHMQFSIVESGLIHSARRYNDLKVSNERLTRTLKSRLDELDTQKKAYESMNAMKNATTSDGMRIDQLQREIVQVEEDIEKKAHYTRQLQHMLSRLQDNQLKFESHMNGMEEAMRAIQREAQEVRHLKKDLEQGCSKAQLMLEDTQANLYRARKSRETMTAQRVVEFKNAQTMQEWIRRREEVKAQMVLELRGDLTAEEEGFLRSQISEKVEKTKNLQQASEASHRRLQLLEDAFTKLKQVTGVSSLEEMHEKFSNQKQNKKNLEQEVKDAEARLQLAKKNNSKQERAFQELKSSGGGIAELTREAINKLEEAISAAKNEQKITRAATERLASVLLGLDQGSRGLLQRVQPYLDLADGSTFELTQVDEDLPWKDTLEALSTSEQVLTKMLEVLNGDGGQQALRSPFGERGEDGGDMEITSLFEVPVIANNVRIKSRKVLRESENKMVEEEGERATEKTDGPSAQDDGEAPPSFSSGQEDSSVPSRLLVKKNSSRTTQDAKRREETEIRRRNLMDRMADKSSLDDLGIANAARLKMQRSFSSRMSSALPHNSLPDGVSLRDDPITKASAYLTNTPKLL